MADELKRLAAEREEAWLDFCAKGCERAAAAEKAERAVVECYKAREKWIAACNAERDAKMAANPDAPRLSDLRGAFPDCTDGLPVAEYLKKIRAEKAAANVEG